MILVAFFLLIFLYSLVSRRLERSVVTAPLRESTSVRGGLGWRIEQRRTIRVCNVSRGGLLPLFP
jgi:hypothetical protein